MSARCSKGSRGLSSARSRRSRDAQLVQATVGQQRMTSFWLLEVTKLERRNMHDVTLPPYSNCLSCHLRFCREHQVGNGKDGITRVTKISHRDYCLNTNTEKMDGWIDGQTDRQTV
jgi:hypothetical protein